MSSTGSNLIVASTSSFPLPGLVFSYKMKNLDFPVLISLETSEQSLDWDVPECGREQGGLPKEGGIT